MSAEGKSLLVLLLANAVFLATSATASAQAGEQIRAGKLMSDSSPGTVESLRVINGRMKGSAIAGEFLLKGRPTQFALTLSKAEIVDSELQFFAVLSLEHRALTAQKVRAKIAGTLAMAANPWPGPSNAGPELVSGCGVLFLRWDPLESTCRHASLSIL